VAYLLVNAASYDGKKSARRRVTILCDDHVQDVLGFVYRVIVMKIMTFFLKLCKCRPRLCCGDGSVG